MSSDDGSPPAARLNSLGPSSTDDYVENPDSPSHTPQETDAGQVEGSSPSSRGGKASRGRVGSRIGRQQQFDYDVMDQFAEFFRNNPCFYDKEAANHSNKDVKDDLLADFSSQVGVPTHQILKWYDGQRRYYVQFVSKQPKPSGRAAKRARPHFDWNSRNFSFLNGHTRQPTRPTQLGSSIHRSFPTLYCDDSESDGTEDTQDMQDSQDTKPACITAEPAASKRHCTRKIEDVLVDDNDCKAERSERLTPSLPPPKQPIVNTQSDESNFLGYFAKEIAAWDPRTKRRFLKGVSDLFFDLADSVDAQ